MDLLQCGQKMTLPIMKFRTGSTCVWLHLKQRTGMSHESMSGRGTKLTSGSAYAEEAPVFVCWIPLVTSVAGLLAADAALAGASAFAFAAAGWPWPFRNRDSKLSSNRVSGCRARARAISASSVSTLFGSVTQQSTGQTAAHAS